RLTSRQLLNQETVEAELDRIAGRQAALDARQDSIAGLSQAARRAGIDLNGVVTATAAPVEPDPADDADSDTAGDSTADHDDGPSYEKTSSIAPIRGSATALAYADLRRTPAIDMISAADARLGTVQGAINSLARDQVAYVDAVAAKVSNRTGKIAAVLKRLGQHVPPSYTQKSDVGGPFVAVDE